MRLLMFLLSVCIGKFANAEVIAHRGASGYLPEHTIESVTLAYGMGADYIEQDLVLSKDGVLVVLHDIHLETVTNVEQVFPTRHRQDKRYYALDFTLTELKRLTVHERQDKYGKPVYANRYRGQKDFKIATFEEQILLIRELNHSTGRDIGLYPEVKSPKWHQQQGHDISQRVIDLLRKYQLDKRTANIYLQCFDFLELKRIRHQLNGKLKLVQLIGENDWQESDTDYDYLRTAKGMGEIAKVAQGVGPWFPQLFVNPTKLKGPLSPWVSEAKKHQLLIHPYTHRIDQLPSELSSQQLLDKLFNQAGVNGVFTDFPDVVRRYLESN